MRKFLGFCLLLLVSLAEAKNGFFVGVEGDFVSSKIQFEYTKYTTTTRTTSSYLSYTTTNYKDYTSELSSNEFNGVIKIGGDLSVNRLYLAMGKGFLGNDGGLKWTSTEYYFGYDVRAKIQKWRIITGIMTGVYKLDLKNAIYKFDDYGVLLGAKVGVGYEFDNHHAIEAGYKIKAMLMGISGNNVYTDENTRYSDFEYTATSSGLFVGYSYRF